MFILIDSGSTHNFMDVQMAAKMKCEMKSAGLANVNVADGSKIGIKGKVE